MTMFEEVCNLSPKFVRHFTRNGILRGLEQLSTEDVTECLLYGIVKESTPPKHLTKALQVLEDHATNNGKNLDEECDVPPL